MVVEEEVMVVMVVDGRYGLNVQMHCWLGLALWLRELMQTIIATTPIIVVVRVFNSLPY